MRAALHVHLDGDLLLLEELLQALRVRKLALHEDFPQQREELRQFARERLRLHAQLRQERLRRVLVGVGTKVEAHAARMKVREIREFHIGMLLRVHAAEQGAEQISVWQILLHDPRGVEIECEVGDAVRLHVALEQFPARDLADRQRQLVGLPADVAELQHRNRRERLRRIRRLLAQLERLRPLDDGLDFLRAHRLLARRELLCHHALFLCCERRRRRERQKYYMRIIEQICLYKPLEIPLREAIAQFLERILIEEIVQRIAVIEPAPQAMDIVDEPFRRRAEIRLAQLELKAVE